MTTNTKQKKTRRKLFIPSQPDLIRDLSKRELQILFQVGYGKYMTADLIAARLRYKYLKAPVVKQREVNGQTVISKSTGKAIREETSELFDKGWYLHRDARQVVLRGTETGSHKMIYELPAKGRYQLQKVKKGATKDFQKPRSTFVPQMQHTVMINHLRVAMSLECEQNPALKLLHCTMLPRDLRWKVTYYPPNRDAAVTRQLVADMLLTFQYDKWRISDFNEATISNKDAHAIVDKIRRYEAYDASSGHKKQHGIKSFRVLFTTEDEKTRDNLRRLAVDSPLKHRLYFGCIKDIDPWNHATVLNNMWVTGASTEPRSLLPDIS